MIELVLGVHPLERQPLHDGVPRSPHRDCEIVLASVSGALSLWARRDESSFPSGVVDSEAASECRVAPTQAEHAIPLFPFWEGVVGRVDIDEAPTLIHPG